MTQNAINLTGFPNGFRHVVVEGPIGAGKTTLAKELNRAVGGKLLLEEFEENPFLPLLYNDFNSPDSLSGANKSMQYALQTELHFLLSRHRQNQAFHQSVADEKITSDYMFSKCRAFARLTLDDLEFNLFNNVYDLIAPTIPEPDLVIYLDAPVSILLDRISNRGRKLENTMSGEYLANLRKCYERELEHIPEGRLLRVDTTDMDLRKKEAQEWLVEKVTQLEKSLNSQDISGTLSS